MALDDLKGRGIEGRYPSGFEKQHLADPAQCDPQSIKYSLAVLFTPAYQLLSN